MMNCFEKHNDDALKTLYYLGKKLFEMSENTFFLFQININFSYS